MKKKKRHAVAETSTGDSNRLVEALTSPVRQRLLDASQHVALTFKQPLYEKEQKIRDVYFILSGVASLLTTSAEGATVEVGTVGNEGLVGLPVFFGADTIPGDARVQVPGAAWRIDAAVFRRVAREHDSLALVISRYAQSLFNQIAQSVACNRLHSIEERCSRWLLMTHDRVHSDEFPLTQEFLGQMLGVRRASVNVAAGMLQKAGLIRYVRGRITVVDRAGLESTACDCYKIIRDDIERLFP